MNEKNSISDFPYDLPESFGQVRAATEEIPGVFYVSVVQAGEILLPQEYYLVRGDAPAISEQAKQYGYELMDQPKIRAYNLEDPKSGYQAIQYEISKYKIRKGYPVLESEAPLAVSRRAMEYLPDYFGDYPAPMETPWGRTTRYRRLSTGIFWIETEVLEECLAVCQPVWEGDLSEKTQKLGRGSSREGLTDLRRTQEYAFYSAEDSCLPLFELQQDVEELQKYLNVPALMNALWTYHPTFALEWNTALRTYGASQPQELRELTERRLLRMTNGSGTQFLRIPSWNP